VYPFVVRQWRLAFVLRCVFLSLFCHPAPRRQQSDQENIVRVTPSGSDLTKTATTNRYDSIAFTSQDAFAGFIATETKTLAGFVRMGPWKSTRGQDLVGLYNRSRSIESRLDVIEASGGREA
jgi:hypothetical protein